MLKRESHVYSGSKIFVSMRFLIHRFITYFWWQFRTDINKIFIKAFRNKFWVSNSAIINRHFGDTGGFIFTGKRVYEQPRFLSIFQFSAILKLSVKKICLALKQLYIYTLFLNAWYLLQWIVELHFMALFLW